MSGSCPKKDKPKWATISATTETAVWRWLSDWMPVTGLGAVDVALNVERLYGTGAGEVAAATQLAAVRPDEPDAPSAMGSYVDSTGFHHFRQTPSGGNYAWWRYGVMIKLKSSETGEAVADVTAHATYAHCGRSLGAARIDVQQYQGTDASYFPVSDWTPLVGMDSLKAAFVVMDNEDDHLEYILVARLAVDPSEPGAWTVVESAWVKPAAGNSARNTGAQSVPGSPSSNSLIQLGVAVRKESAADGPPRATIHVATFAKY